MRRCVRQLLTRSADLFCLSPAEPHESPHPPAPPLYPHAYTGLLGESSFDAKQTVGARDGVTDTNIVDKLLSLYGQQSADLVFTPPPAEPTTMTATSSPSTLYTASLATVAAAAGAASQDTPRQASAPAVVVPRRMSSSSSVKKQRLFETAAAVLVFSGACQRGHADVPLPTSLPTSTTSIDYLGTGKVYSEWYTGTIPTEFGDLTAVTYLNLAKNCYVATGEYWCSDANNGNLQGISGPIPTGKQGAGYWERVSGARCAVAGMRAYPNVSASD